MLLRENLVTSMTPTVSTEIERTLEVAHDSSFTDSSHAQFPATLPTQNDIWHKNKTREPVFNIGISETALVLREAQVSSTSIRMEHVGEPDRLYFVIPASCFFTSLEPIADSTSVTRQFSQAGVGHLTIKSPLDKLAAPRNKPPHGQFHGSAATISTALPCSRRHCVCLDWNSIYNQNQMIT